MKTRLFLKSAIIAATFAGGLGAATDLAPIAAAGFEEWGMTCPAENASGSSDYDDCGMDFTAQCEASGGDAWGDPGSGAMYCISPEGRSAGGGAVLADKQASEPGSRKPGRHSASDQQKPGSRNDAGGGNGQRHADSAPDAARTAGN